MKPHVSFGTFPHPSRRLCTPNVDAAWRFGFNALSAIIMRGSIKEEGPSSDNEEEVRSDTAQRASPGPLI